MKEREFEIDVQTAEDLASLLEELRKDMRALATLLISRHGLIIATSLLEESIHGNANSAGAMLSIGGGAIENALGQLGKGPLDRIIAYHKHGITVLTGAGPKAILVVDLNKGLESMIGMGIIERAVERIKSYRKLN